MDAETMIDELLEYDGEALTAWEIEFVDSLDKQRLAGWNGHDGPSPKQLDTLERIFEKL